MKRGLLVVIALLLIVSVAAISCAQPAPAPTPAPAPKPAPAPEKTFQLKYTSGYPPPPYPDSFSEQKWMDLVTEGSNGRITFEAFWAGALGGPGETLALVRSGAADVGCVAYGAHPSEFPLYGFDYAFPFGPPDPAIVVKAAVKLWEEFPGFEQDCANQNLHHLFILPWDNYDLISTKPIETLADMKGMRCGVWGIYFPKWVEAVGGTGVNTASPERYLNLQTGILDVSIMPIQPTVSLKLHEVAKHWTTCNIGAFWPHPNSMNLDTWNSLPADLQKICTDTGRQVELEHAAMLLEKQQADFDLIKAAGVTFHTLPDADRAEWAAKAPDLPAEWAKEATAKGYPGWEIAQRYQELCEELGYKWPRKWAVK